MGHKKLTNYVEDVEPHLCKMRFQKRLIDWQRWIEIVELRLQCKDQKKRMKQIENEVVAAVERKLEFQLQLVRLYLSLFERNLSCLG